MRHQSPVRSRARSEYFYARAVRVQLHTRVFLKFKSSCTVEGVRYTLLLWDIFYSWWQWPLPWISDGNAYILVSEDHFTRW